MLLKKGSSGEDVKKLQAKLGLGADGIVGEKTLQAIDAALKAAGHDPDKLTEAYMKKRVEELSKSPEQLKAMKKAEKMRERNLRVRERKRKEGTYKP